MGIQNGTSLYKGNFDLTNILDVENKKNQNYVLCYECQSQINF